jgi:NADH:ubiquinone oxidoreductase subunit
MAKTQTFSDKLKKKVGQDNFPVKVVSWSFDENRGTLRCNDRIVILENQNEINNL